MRESAQTYVTTGTRWATPLPRRRSFDYPPRAALVGDALAMIVIAVTAASLRTWLGWFTGPVDVEATLDSFWTAGPLILLCWIVVIAALGGYRERLFGSGIDEYKIMLNSSLVTAGLTGVACYLAKFDLSRGFYALVFGLGSVVLVGQRAFLRRALHRARRAGRFLHNVVIAGTPTNVDGIARVLRREAWLGYRVLGAVVPAGLEVEETATGTPVLGTTDRLLEVLRTVDAGVVFIAGGALECPEQMRELVWQLEDRDTQVVVAPSVTDVSRERVRVRPAGGLPLVHIDPPRHVRATRRAKRVFDLVVASLLVIGVVPMLAAISLAIKLHDGGPVLFRQERIGRNGRAFSCLKFRTMVIDAERQQAAMQAEQGHLGALWKMKEDPRVTLPGRWLRRYSLDELPQLFNVLRGDMSLVGPRPQIAAEVATYDATARRRLRVRPGMTGLWQVSGRSELSWSEAVRLDLYYVDNWSMLQDLGILARTFGAVVGSRGAY